MPESASMRQLTRQLPLSIQSKDGGATATPGEMSQLRIDGACPMPNPTAAEIRWAANRWGINPLLLYTVATQEGDWENDAVSDDRCSSGSWQIADRNTSERPDHAVPGFTNVRSMFARESSALMQLFGHTCAAFHGLTRECQRDIGAAIQTWVVSQTKRSGSLLGFYIARGRTDSAI